MDCAASLGLEDAPDSVAELEASLDRVQLRDVREECPQCLTNLRATVCAQKLPPCGAFDAAITAVLPALQKVPPAAAWGTDHLSRGVLAVVLRLRVFESMSSLYDAMRPFLAHLTIAGKTRLF